MRCLFVHPETQTQVGLRWGTWRWPLDYVFAGSTDPTRPDCYTLKHHLVSGEDGNSAAEHLNILERFLVERAWPVAGRPAAPGRTHRARSVEAVARFALREYRPSE